MQPATEPKEAMNLVSNAEEASAAKASAPPSSAPGSRAKFVLLVVFLLAAAARPMPPSCTIRNRVSSDDANVDGHISAIAPKISGNVIEVLVIDNQTGQDRRRCWCASIRAITRPGGSRQSRAVAGRKPVAHGRAAGGAAGSTTPPSPAITAAAAAAGRRQSRAGARPPRPTSRPPAPTWPIAEANVAVQAGQQRSRPGRPGAHEAAGRQGRDLQPAVRFLHRRRARGRQRTAGRPGKAGFRAAGCRHPQGRARCRPVPRQPGPGAGGRPPWPTASRWPSARADAGTAAAAVAAAARQPGSRRIAAQLHHHRRAHRWRGHAQERGSGPDRRSPARAS